MIEKKIQVNTGRDARLLAYCAMAGGALMAAQPADAAIVYSGVKNLIIDNSTVRELNLDLNGDNDTDFVFKTSSGKYYQTALNGGYLNLKVNGSQGMFLLNEPQNYIASIDGVKLRPGAAIPGEVKNWNGTEAFLNGLIYSGTAILRLFPPTPVSTNITSSYGGPFDNSTGYLGVSFQIDNNTHYGWIQYKGRDYDNNSKIVYEGIVIDWAYEELPLTPILAGQRPCADADGDGYGQGVGCRGTDCDDDNASIHDNCTIPPPPPPEPCDVVLTPGSISKFFSRFFPFAAIAIRGVDNATISRTSEIDWGTEGVKTLFVLPGGNNTIRAVVRIKPLSLQSGKTYDVSVGECVGRLSVR